jgi:hypothetical protein
MNEHNTIYKHRNCIIETTPSEQHPDMVTITQTPKLRNHFLERRYVTINHAHKAIELFESERLINSKTPYIKSQLQDVVVLEDPQ